MKVSTEGGPEIVLHYASAGQPGKPLLLLLHGFPEFWYTWRNLMPSLGEHFFVVAPDQRGYNLSSKPGLVEDYRASQLMRDIDGLIAGLGYAEACLVAHDWGGAIAWGYAASRPRKVKRLVIINAPHAIPFAKALAHDPAQQAASQYMNFLRSPGSGEQLAAQNFEALCRLFAGMGAAVNDSGTEAWFSGRTKAAYLAAWSVPGALEASINWYRASPIYPPVEGEGADPGAAKLKLNPKDFQVDVPTKLLWGDRDLALLPVLLDGLEDVVSQLTLVRLSGHSHWVIHEAPERIAREILDFLQPELERAT
jgi:epoxide hydrolase 4